MSLCEFMQEVDRKVVDLRDRANKLRDDEGHEPRSPRSLVATI